MAILTPYTELLSHLKRQNFRSKAFIQKTVINLIFKNSP